MTICLVIRAGVLGCIFAALFVQKVAAQQCLAPPGEKRTPVALADQQGNIWAPIKGGGWAYMQKAPPCGRLYEPLDFEIEGAPCRYATGYYDDRRIGVCAREARRQGRSLGTRPGDSCKHRIMVCHTQGFIVPKGPKYDMPPRHQQPTNKKREAAS